MYKQKINENQPMAIKWTNSSNTNLCVWWWWFQNIQFSVCRTKWTSTRVKSNVHERTCIIDIVYLYGRSVCGTRSQLTDVCTQTQRKSEVIEWTSEIVLKTRSRSKNNKIVYKTAARTYELKKRVFHRETITHTHTQTIWCQSNLAYVWARY